MKQLKQILTIALLLLAWGLHAQHSVKGTVTDKADGTPIIGATVRELNGNAGAITDVDGKFELKVSSPEAVLSVTYTGYSPTEVPIEGRSELSITIGFSDNVLEQVVVVGYGTQKKTDLTGAVGSVKSKDLERIPTASVDQALQGKMAGVYVTPTSGEPGVGAVIRIRGTGTLNNSNPIYVVDGMITYDASFVNPQDVQSIEVLKDASAAAIYGSRGSNGVIIITTKNGKKRKDAVITLGTYYGTQSITKKLDLLNATEFGTLYNELINQQYYPDPSALGEGTDWQDEIFRTAPIGNVQLGINGGSDRYSYNVSANYFNQSGILKNSEFERVTLRLNNEFKVNNWLTLGNNLAYANVQRQYAPGVIGGAYRMPPVFAPRDSTGDFTDPTSPFGLAIGNPAAELYYRQNNFARSDRFFGTIYGNIQLAKGLTFRSNFGFDIENSRGRSFTPKFEVSASQLNKDDQLNVSIGEKRDWIWEQTLNYNKEWGKHSVTVLAGYTAEERRYEFLNAGRRNFPGTSDVVLYLNAGNDTTQTNNGGAQEEALVSYLFRLNYTFNDRYLLTFSMRTDQSSRFTAGNRTGVFPSVGLGWNIGQEDFIQNLNIFDNLKLRASYGVLGNQSSAGLYPSYGSITTALYAVFGSGEDLNQGGTLITLGNPDLRWETARQTDAGVEFGLLGSRLTGEIDWYNRFTYDIIAAVPIPAYVGSSGDPVVNTAKVRNRGWDIMLNWRNNGDNFIWNIGGNISPVKNEIVELNGQKAEIFAAFLQGEPATRSAPGLPIGAFYGYVTDGVFNTAEEAASSPRLDNESAGDLKLKDLNGDGVITADGDRTYLGSPIPSLTYGFNAGMEWKGFDLNADLFGVSGNKVYNAKQTFRFSVYNWEQSFYDNRWTPQNPDAATPRITNGGHNYRVTDRFLEDGGFIRLRSLVLGYSLPQSLIQRLKITKFRLYAGGTNIWTNQKYSGYSPEFGNSKNAYEVGLDNLGYPVAKTWQVGFDVTF